jgi:hypothetical protein
MYCFRVCEPRKTGLPTCRPREYYCCDATRPKPVDRRPRGLGRGVLFNKLLAWGRQKRSLVRTARDALGVYERAMRQVKTLRRSARKVKLPRRALPVSSGSIRKTCAFPPNNGCACLCGAMPASDADQIPRALAPESGVLPGERSSASLPPACRAVADRGCRAEHERHPGPADLEGADAESGRQVGVAFARGDRGDHLRLGLSCRRAGSRRLGNRLAHRLDPSRSCSSAI